MRLVFLFLLTGCVSTENSFEKSRFIEGKVCREMVGTWYSDISVINHSGKNVRHITQVKRSGDGSGYLKGVTFYVTPLDVHVWEFPMSWSCDYEWYTEKNKWGFTSFKIKSLGDEIFYIDELRNLGVEQYVYPESQQYQAPNPKIREFFGL